MVRLENPDDEIIDYMLTLDGFKELGELCVALSKFCEEIIIVNGEQLEHARKNLTYENIMNYVKISAMKKKKS